MSLSELLGSNEKIVGGKPDVDIAHMYLKSYFFDSNEAVHIAEEYRKDTILCGEMKQMLYEKLMDRIIRSMEVYSNGAKKI